MWAISRPKLLQYRRSPAVRTKAVSTESGRTLVPTPLFLLLLLVLLLLAVLVLVLLLRRPPLAAASTSSNFVLRIRMLPQFLRQGTKNKKETHCNAPHPTAARIDFDGRVSSELESWGSWQGSCLSSISEPHRICTHSSTEDPFWNAAAGRDGLARAGPRLIQGTAAHPSPWVSSASVVVQVRELVSARKAGSDEEQSAFPCHVQRALTKTAVVTTVPRDARFGRAFGPLAS